MNYFYKSLKICGFIISVGVCCFKLQAASTITIEKDTATTLPLDGKVQEVFVSNPDIADVQSNGPDTAYVYGKKPGVTSIFLGGKKGKTEPISIVVTHSLTPLRKTMNLVYPEEKITVTSSPAGIVLSGKVTSSKIAKDMENLSKQYVEKEEKIVNNLTISTPTQVYLKVKFAEIRRDVLNSFSPNLGVNVNSPGRFSYALLTGARAPIDTTTNLFSRGTDPFGSYGFRVNDGTTDLAGLLDVLESEGLGSILAEPNLTALSGETASFLSGGEFPFPVPQGNSSISIEFKPFGISLAFTPTVLGPNMINLRVRPEVSELDRTNGTTYSVDGITQTIPALRTRKAETSVEMSSGQSFAIAGLLSSSTVNTLKEVPGVASIPILGNLFTSTSFQKNQTELVIIVTPYIVNPTAERDLAKPTDGLKHASSLEMLFQKRVNHVDGRDKSTFDYSTDCLECSAGFYVE